MHRSNRLRPPTSEVLQHQRREEAFDAANRIFVEKGRTACGVYIRKNIGVDDVESLLKSFNVEFIPPVSDRYTKLDPQVEIAAQSLSRVAVIFNSLEASSLNNRPSTLPPLKDQAFSLLAEYWPSVSKWVEFFLQCRSSASRIEERNLSACLDVLSMVSWDGSDATTDQHKEHICTMPCTGKNILDTLLLFDSRISDYRMVRGENLVGQPVGPCLVAGLVRSLSKSRAWDEVLTAALRTRGTKRAVVDSLVGRAQGAVGMALEGENMAWASQTLLRIVFGVCRFTTDFVDEFRRQDAHRKVTEALSAIAEEGNRKMIVDPDFWTDLAEAIMLLVIISCERESVIRHVDQSSPAGNGVRKAMNELLPYLTASKVFIAAALRGDLSLLSEQPPASTAELDVTKIYKNWRIESHICSLAFGSGRDVFISVCANLNHPSGVNDHQKERNGVTQTCSSCHSVIYCSRECQVEDWAAFHRYECRSATREYQGRKAAMVRFGPTMQTDQIKYLQTLANFHLASPPEILRTTGMLDMLNPAETWFGLYPEHALTPRIFSPESTIAVFDCSKPGLPFVYHPRISLTSYHTVYWDFMDAPWWNPRILQYVRDAEANPDITLLVEGVFRFDYRRDIAVLTKTEYRPDAQEGQKYRVVNSLLRVSTRAAE